MDWLAVSIQGEVEKYGAYVGIAAFFGLAVLSLLYFAQARELKRLREWAGRAPERAQELEARVVAQADAARQTAPVRRLAEMPVIPPPPPVPAATAAASAPEADAPPQATVEADVLEESDEAVAAPSTNGHHEGPVPPPETAVRAPDGDEDAAVPAAVAAGEAESGQAEEPPAGEEGDRDPEDEATEDAAAPDAATTDADDAEAAERGPSEADDAEAEGEEPQSAGSEAAGFGAAVAAAAAANEATRVHPPGADDETKVHAAADEAEHEPAPVPDEAEREPVGATADAEAAPAAGEPEGDAAEDEHDVDEAPPSTAIPRATPAQRPLTAPRPAAAPLSRSQPSASPRRPGGAPPRRGATAAPGRERRSVGTVALLAGMAVLVMGAGAFAASQLLGGSEEPQQPNQTSQPATSTATATPAQQAGAEPPAETVVAVLNGTTFNGLAGTIADQLGAAGYQRGATITNPDQTLQTSTVFFADGARANARRIARRLNVAEVRAVDATTRALAPDADVIVLAGADQAP